MGKRLWSGFGNASWCRVKDISVQSWLGNEYHRIRAGATGISRRQSDGILQEALRNYAQWVDSASGVEEWCPVAVLPLNVRGAG